MIDLLAFCALALVLSGCDKKANVPSNPVEKQNSSLDQSTTPSLRTHNQLEASDSYQNKVANLPKSGLANFTKEEREKWDQEIARSLFMTVRAKRFREFEAMAQLDPNFGMVKFDPNMKDASGNTILMAAVSADAEDFVEYFLKRGSNPSVKNSSGESALSLAKTLGNKKLIDRLTALR